ncbi:hypothetical protein K4K59_000578 [Colletotrichum sp. SAR11_240]|nr:hypothetical protein K4K59_000578 [Colletotrichum sp. SAR11_240]
MLNLCKGDCEKLLAVIEKLKAPGASKRRWRSFRAALTHVWAASDIEYLEDRLTKTQTSMTLVIVSLSSKAQEFRMDELKRLQDQCQILQIDQAARITGFMSEMREFKASLGFFQERHRREAPPSEEIDRLEEKLRKMSLSHASIRDEQGILKSLSFEAQPIRHENIPKAYQKTFEWVYQPQSDDQNTVGHFAQWLKSDEQFFWVSGKPGSGKSTFMKFVAGEARTRGLLSKWAKANRLVIASHYFWSAGTELQKSEHGLLRNLLYDIFRQCPDLILPICGKRRAGPDEVSEQEYLPWTLPELYDALGKVAAYDKGFRLCLFIDGLDEYMGEHTKMI